MAKKSLIAREVKRQKLVAKYADLRAQLKAEGKWDELDKLKDLPELANVNFIGNPIYDMIKEE